MRFYERVVRPLLQRFDPETSHALTISTLSVFQRFALFRWLAARICSFQDPRLKVTWRGLAFQNPIGLAAGVDKDARAARLFASLGFGSVEVGTVTPLPQPGNPRPRVFRLPARRALVNSLGFPSQGMETVANRLKGNSVAVPLGINIGKNAETPLSEATADYLSCLEALYPYGDYFVLNISSPNTAGLTSLQAKPALTSLTAALRELRTALAEASNQDPKPLLLKLSADLTRAELDDVLEVATGNEVDGIVAVNTSASPEIKGDAQSISGGISGPPLRQQGLELVGYARRHVPRDFFIIGVGGITDERDAWAYLRAGANVVQVYTTLVYRGPCAVSSINRGLLSLLESSEVPSIQTLNM